MKIREIPANLPKDIYNQSKENYVDVKTGYNVAVKKTMYKGRVREMCVVYEKTVDEVNIITIHPLKAYEKEARIRIGRWKKL